MKGLNMEIRLRAAAEQDAAGIAELIARSFGDGVNPAYIAGLLAHGGRLCFVVQQEGQVLGFVDGFLTQAADGAQRQELDLLAVHPDARGKGLGSALVKHFTARSAALFPTAMIRALVAADNLPMQHNLRKHGYRQQPDLCELWVASRAVQGACNATPTAHVIAVQTLSYRGIWMEGVIHAEAIQTALRQREAQSLDVVGVVLAQRRSGEIALLREAGFQRVGAYHWWQWVPG